MHQITEGLIQQGISVKVLALSPTKQETAISQIPDKYRQQTGFESVSIDTQVKLLPAFLNLFSRESYNIKRFYSKQMEDLIKQVLLNKPFDIIQLEGLYLTPYIPALRAYSKAPILYRSHNIEHLIWFRLAHAANNPFKKRYLQLLARRLEAFENKVIHDVDGLVAISENDRQYFSNKGFSGPSVVIPAGMPSIRESHDIPKMEYNSVFHLGSMDWRPNQEGVIWFLKKVWPLVVSKKPALKFYLAGKRMPAYFHQFADKRVEVMGEVDDAVDFLLSKNIMVVPLLSGGGMRVKIIEGMAVSKAIVSTTIGAEGIGCIDGEHIYLADSPEEMAKSIVYCIDNPDAVKKTGQQAHLFAQRNFSRENIIKKLIMFYKGFYSN